MTGGTITVLYPAGVTFNMDYYVKSHMPMVHNNLKSYGLNGYRVTKNVGTASGAESPYAVTCALHLDDLEQFQKGMEVHGAEILGDVPNFSDKEPTLIIGEVTTVA
ncbi:MAG: hypothetical protein M1821_003306 [Bathelium mastoideum]|nr:MAG: hypothetical protein M1821_003306 [Bathelium mastoideum]KAI9689338.1 MAG: hypothetical protein M1822_009989 [Bathelium mastoideum]